MAKQVIDGVSHNRLSARVLIWTFGATFRQFPWTISRSQSPVGSSPDLDAWWIESRYTLDMITVTIACRLES